MTQPDLNITTALEAIAEGLYILQLLAGTTNNLGWLDDSIPLSKLNELAQSLGYRDAQSVYTQVEHDRDMEECHAEIRQLCTRLTMLDAVEATLADCGIGEIYAEFDTPADAVEQMSQYIDELTREDGRRTEQVKALQSERQLRQEAEGRITEMNVALGKALDATKTPRAYKDGQIMTITERIFWLNSKLQHMTARWHCAKQRAETLAQLVTPELAALLEGLARVIDETGIASDVPSVTDEIERAFALAARIHEALEANGVE